MRESERDREFSSANVAIRRRRGVHNPCGSVSPELRGFCFYESTMIIEQGPLRLPSHPNLPLFNMCLFNGPLHDFLSPHVSQFINIIRPFAMLPPSNRNARILVRACAPACMYICTICASAPPSEILSVHRMWDKSISHSFWSGCCCLCTSALTPAEL